MRSLIHLTSTVNKGHRVIMYVIETKAICWLLHYGQFLGSHPTVLWGGGDIFVDFIFQFTNEILNIN